MNSIEELVTLVRDELGLPVALEDADRPLDDIAGWDSMHLLLLSTLLEQRTGRRLSLPDVLQAGSLAQLYAVATGGAVPATGPSGS